MKKLFVVTVLTLAIGFGFSGLQAQACGACGGASKAPCPEDYAPNAPRADIDECAQIAEPSNVSPNAASDWTPGSEDAMEPETPSAIIQEASVGQSGAEFDGPASTNAIPTMYESESGRKLKEGPCLECETMQHAPGGLGSLLYEANGRGILMDGYRVREYWSGPILGYKSEHSNTVYCTYGHEVGQVSK